jgi:hypothetical protein
MHIATLICWLISAGPGPQQKIYTATTSTITFFAGTPVEDIDAVNKKAVSFLNIESGEVVVSIPNREFHFKRALMEDHFNENYMESEKYPKSEFKGSIDNPTGIQWNAGEYDITVTGTLSIHGVSKRRTLPAHIRIGGEKIDTEMKFNIPLADHHIDRPQILWEKLAETVEVHATITYEPYKK